jgi:6-phosphogluconolactonase
MDAQDARDSSRGDARAAERDAERAAEDAQSGASDGDAASVDATVPDASAPVALESFVYVGGYGATDYPVRTFRLDRTTGTLSEIDTSSAFGRSPTFITPNASGTRLYMTNEQGEAGITVASIDAVSGKPTRLDKRGYTGGGAYVFAAIDPSGKYLFAADYEGGRFGEYPIADDGKLGTTITNLPFDKAGDKSAQTHSVAVHPSGRWVYVANKALNKIAQFAMNPQNGQLTRLADAATSKAGPRVIALTPSGQYAYVMHEDSSALNAFRVNEDGTLTEIDSKLAQPSGTSKKWGAHAVVHPSGKFVYASDRGSNTISVFAIGNDGKLTALETKSVEGMTPRCFDIDDQGQWLVVANQDSNSVFTFEIGGDGKLTKRAGPITAQQPSAVAIVNRPR